MAAQDSLKVATIFGRTASGAGTGVPDIDQEEMRLLATALIGPGYLPSMIDQTTNASAFTVAQNTGADLNVKVGSGTTKKDGFVIIGTVAGQGAYVVRLDATTKTVSVPAADTVNPARYGVYLYVDDASYSGDASRAYANVSCIRGTPAGSPTTPGPLAVWSASYLLWEFQLAANATAVTTAILNAGVDQRKPARSAITSKMGGVTVTSSQSGIGGSITDLTSYAISWPALANREYLVTAKIPVSQITSSGTPLIDLTTSGNTQLDRCHVGAMGAGETRTAYIVFPYTPGAGVASIKMRGSTNAGTLTLPHTATVPGTFRVYDMGL